MRKLLVVSPHFAPVNAPDMHRVRLALPWLRENGWEPVVLTVAPDMVEGGVRDPLLEQTYPDDIRVVRVRGFAPHLTRWARVGSLWLRCGRALRSAGDRLLAGEQFDLVFFSTTQFGAFTLGPRWKRKFGVPYVLDYQDPWVNDHYGRTGQRPPGGRLKFAVTRRLAQYHEPHVLRSASGVIAVSGAYAHSLAKRYPWFEASRVDTLPFGAAELDVELARDHVPAQPLVPCGDGKFHHVYTGRGGNDMRVALTILFRGFKRFRDAHPDEASRIHFHFIGTSYAPSPHGKETVMPVAKAEGVAEHVHEHCGRVPYFEALHYLTRADAVLALGSDDPGYNASKIFPCLLVRRPLLALFHKSSPVFNIVQHASKVHAYAFGGADLDEAATIQVAEHWFSASGMRDRPSLNTVAFAPFTARAMTQTLSTVFVRATGAAPQ
jgi:hypothetical protein